MFSCSVLVHFLYGFAGIHCVCCSNCSWNTGMLCFPSCSLNRSFELLYQDIRFCPARQDFLRCHSRHLPPHAQFLFRVMSPAAVKRRSTFSYRQGVNVNENVSPPANGTLRGPFSYKNSVSELGHAIFIFGAISLQPFVFALIFSR